MTVLVDLILLGMAVEAAALLAWRRRDAVPLMPNLAAGACLLLAMRAALGGAAWPVAAACLGAAGLAHVADLRWRLAR